MPEPSDPERGFDPYASGLFDAHWECDELPDGFESGPTWVPAAEAIAWARERSPVVIVRVSAAAGEPQFYSAGEHQPDYPDAPYPVWPEEGLELEPRREPGWEFLNRSSKDPPIQWDVMIDAYQGHGE